MVAGIVPICVSVIVLLLVRSGGLTVCCKHGFVISRSRVLAFFAWFLIGALCIMSGLIFSGEIETESLFICNYIAIGILGLEALILVIYCFNKIIIKGSEIEFVSQFGKKIVFDLSEITRVKYTHLFGGLTVYTTKGTLLIDGYFKDTWYFLDTLRSFGVKGSADACSGYYSHINRPLFYYKSYVAFADSIIEREENPIRALKKLLTHYDICAADNVRNALDLWAAAEMLLINARIKGYSVGRTLPNRMRKFWQKHESVIPQNMQESVVNLVYDKKHDAFYEDVIKIVGKKNMYNRRDFGRVLYHQEVSLGCSAKTVLYNRFFKEDAPVLFVVYPPTEDRKYDMVCSVGAGIHKFPCSKELKVFSRCEISLAFMHETFENEEAASSRHAALSWFSNYHIADGGKPISCFPAALFGDENITVFNDVKYNYFVVLFMEHGSYPYIGSGTNRINFYQLFPMYSGEAAIWEEGQYRLELLHLSGWPDSAADPDRKEVTREMIEDFIKEYSQQEN